MLWHTELEMLCWFLRFVLDILLAKYYIFECSNNFVISNNLEELIIEPTHIRDDGSQSCINLICTDQSYVFTEIGVLPALDPYSKHNIIHGSWNFHNPGPPPYKCNMWIHKTAKIDLIRNDLLNTDWKSLFSGLNTDGMSLVFTGTLLSVFSRYISNKISTCSDKDASWITPVVKSAIRRNSRVYRKWVTRGRKPIDHNKVCEAQNSRNKIIREAKRLDISKIFNKVWYYG